MNQIYFSTGSNLGNPIEYLQKAITEIELMIGKITRKSSIYKSEPWGFDHKNAFLNQVLICESKFSPYEVLDKIQEIERNSHRLRNGNEYSARTLDIDILFYNIIILHDEDLIIPHPLLQDRNFVLYPLCEITPEFVHPVFNKTITELKKECTDDSEIEKILIQ